MPLKFARPTLTWKGLLIRGAIFLWDVVKYPFEPACTNRLLSEEYAREFSGPQPRHYSSMTVNGRYIHPDRFVRFQGGLTREQLLRLQRSGAELTSSARVEERLRKMGALNARRMRPFRPVGREDYKRPPL